MTTRREFLALVLAARAAPPPLVTVPVDILFDQDAKLGDWAVRHFWALWAEAVRDFGWCGVFFRTRVRDAGMWRPPHRQPVISGLGERVLNLVVTNTIPLEWDKTRMVRGITTLYRGHHLCLVAIHQANRHRVPLIGVNTIVHELLHALLLGILEPRPAGVRGHAREARVEWLATRLWLFHSGTGIRESARQYVERLTRAR